MPQLKMETMRFGNGKYIPTRVQIVLLAFFRQFQVSTIESTNTLFQYHQVAQAQVLAMG